MTNFALTHERIESLLKEVESKGIEITTENNPSKEKVSFLRKYFEEKSKLFQ